MLQPEGKHQEQHDFRERIHPEEMYTYEWLLAHYVKLILSSAD